MGKKIFSGSFDRKIVLSKKTQETTDSGAVVYNQTQTKTVWASLFENPINSQVSEAMAEQTMFSRQVLYFIIRYIPGIDTEFIITYNNSKLEIEAIEELGRKKYLKLRCEYINGGVN
jgi:SPP1 family predicted phage head-tail adaptor